MYADFSKCEIRPGCYGVPGGDYDGLNLGYWVDVFQGQCNGYTNFVRTSHLTSLRRGLICRGVLYAS
jgi:hypothetical protein